VAAGGLTGDVNAKGPRDAPEIRKTCEQIGRLHRRVQSSLSFPATTAGCRPLRLMRSAGNESPTSVVASNLHHLVR
jgi:hypothetical protein